MQEILDNIKSDISQRLTNRGYTPSEKRDLAVAIKNLAIAYRYLRQEAEYEAEVAAARAVLAEDDTVA